jgi:hypothetical protein
MDHVRLFNARFNYMFEGPHIGLIFYAGWLPDFALTCEKIDALLGEDKRDFHFVQAREKFGAARYYYSVGGEARKILDEILDVLSASQCRTAAQKRDPVVEEIDRLIDAAQQESGVTCMICGAPGEIIPSPQWLRCVCKKHTRKVCGPAVFEDLIRQARTSISP